MLGAKIRSKRQDKGLTIRQLAEQSGLTPGFLSQIERDLAEPSITSLRKIARIIGVPVFHFLLDETKGNPVVRKRERKILNPGTGDVVFELLSPDLNRTLEMMIGRIQPGAVSCDETLTHEGEENLYVLAGSMKIQVGSDCFWLEEGDSIYYLSGMPHKIWNTGENELVFISAITPPAF